MDNIHPSLERPCMERDSMVVDLDKLAFYLIPLAPRISLHPPQGSRASLLSSSTGVTLTSSNVAHHHHHPLHPPHHGSTGLYRAPLPASSSVHSLPVGPVSRARSAALGRVGLFSGVGVGGGGNVGDSLSVGGNSLPSQTQVSL